MKKTIILGISALLFIVIGCKKDDEVVKDESENITTVKLVFNNGGSSKTYSWKDLDGDGGNSPIIDTIKLSKNTVDSFSVKVLDESKNPIVDITPEILEEKNDHQFFYTVSSALLNTRYLDKDDNGIPVGLQVESSVGNASVGTLQVVLKHQPNVKNGTVAAGETDIDILFPVVIQ